jgi:hypothetical protein
MNNPRYHHHSVAGYMLVLVLVFAGIFITILTAFIGAVISQGRVVNQDIALEQALTIAESGLQYYRWYLAHNPDDVTHGTGLPGPYVIPYGQPPIGEFELSIASTTFCGQVASIQVESTGYTYENPTLRRTVSARYSRPTVAEYSFIINSNVWAGADRVISGPYHSNGGVRMDGTNNSVVTSGQSTWTCTASFGCNPNQTVNGVFTNTTNANPALFAFPSAPINFAGLTVDLALMRSRAIAAGLYFGPSGNRGYRAIVNSNNTITVRRVTSAPQNGTYSVEDDYHYERIRATNSNFVGTYSIPADCPLVFFEDTLWLSGTVNRPVSIATANLGGYSIDPTIILENNITYTSATSSGFLAVAEEDILIGLDVPENMTLQGIFVAQNGRFGRNHYFTGGTYGLPSGLSSHIQKDSLTMIGTIVSNGRVGTKWTNSSGVFTSGFNTRTNSYDRNLVDNPPPLVPRTSDVYELSDWRDETNQ